MGDLARLGLAPGNSRLFDALVERAPVGMFVTDVDGACLYANSRLCELTGVPPERQLGYGWREALHPDDVELVAAAWGRAIREKSDLSHSQRFVRPDGSVAWVEMTAIPTRRGGRVVGWAGVCVDVTARRLSESRYENLVEHARDGVFAIDPLGGIVSANRAAEELTGYSREELLGMSIFDLLAADDVEAAQASMTRSLSGVDEARLALAITARDGRRVFLEVTGRLVTENDLPLRWEAIARDVTEQHLLQEQLAHQAFHDPLTGLPNRALLLDRLGHALAGAARTAAPVAVILLDLDNFKLVNDSLGHETGDRLLREVALRLLQAVRDEDTVARLGGDEFAFVVERLQGAHEAFTVADRILSTFEAPFTVDSSTLRISGSLGIALAHAEQAPSKILRNADTAMYSAKASNRGSFEVFDDGMRNRLLQELELKNALPAALQHKQLQVYYQPIVSLDNGQVLAVEALVRWRHPEWGWIQPSEFVPIAEADGQIVQLGSFVLTETVRQAALWHHRRPDALPLGVFVNVSPRELINPDYATMVSTTLSKLGLPPSRLGLEVTERVFLDDQDERTASNLADLTAMGIRFSLDDFGTGYSSLVSLQRFPFAAIKIDQCFVNAITSATDPAPISAAIISLGNALDLTVIAEGIETTTQADCLHNSGCHAAQGTLYLRPQPANTITRYLEEHPATTTPAYW